MASATVDIKHLEKLVECNICLDQLVEPKMLNCPHSFCKACIEDNILDFRHDKTAVIRCPLRCENETVIEADKTVNDLPTSIHLKNIIELINDVQGRKQEKCDCFNTPDCKKIACYCCLSCLKKLCHPCKTNHTHDESNDGMKFITFRCNEKNHEELLPWCNEHSTYATFKCEDGFICHYCKWRSHAEHNFHDIDTLYDEFYTWIMSQQPQVENLEDLLKKCHVRSTDEAKRIKGILRKEIRIRKQISLEKYIEKLNLEEEELLKTFDSLTDKHLNAYPLSYPHDYISHKSKFEVLVQRENIFDKVKNITGDSVMLPQLSIEYANDAMNNTKPLGMIRGQESNIELMEGVVTVRNEITESKINIERLNVLLEELNLKEIEEVKSSHVGHVSNSDVKNKHKSADVNKSCDVSSERKVADVIRSYKENGTDVKSKLLYLMGLMEKNDIDTFGILMDTLPGELLGLRHNHGYKLIHITSHCENVTFTQRVIEAGEDVDCKDGYGWTPLHKAARCGNINMVKLLIDNNADMLVKSNGGYYNAIDMAKRFNQPHTVKYLQDVLEKKGKVDDGRLSDMTLEQMKQKGWVEEEERDWWNDTKELIKY